MPALWTETRSRPGASTVIEHVCDRLPSTRYRRKKKIFCFLQCPRPACHRSDRGTGRVQAFIGAAPAGLRKCMAMVATIQGKKATTEWRTSPQECLRGPVTRELCRPGRDGSGLFETIRLCMICAGTLVHYWRGGVAPVRIGDAVPGIRSCVDSKSRVKREVMLIGIDLRNLGGRQDPFLARSGAARAVSPAEANAWRQFAPSRPLSEQDPGEVWSSATV